MQPYCSYLICATPRSGSTLLCEALSNTGIAGQPKEYFEALKHSGLPRRPYEYFLTLDDPVVLEHLGRYSRLDDQPAQVQAANYAGYLAQVLEQGTTPNGVFGAKVMWGYFDDFICNLRHIPAYAELPVPDLLAQIFPNLRYIFVTRHDKVQQAVSLWKAIQTWTWKLEDAPQAGEHKLLFNFEAVDHLVQQLKEHEACWWRYFEAANIQPFIVVYEELTQAYEKIALNILRYLHIPMHEKVTFAERRMKRQADSLSDAWVQLYHEHALSRVSSSL